MATKPKLQAVCAICFHTHKLYAKGTLVRHGFQIHGRRNGEFGNAWHTGPCAGWDFPHFGESTKGTEWALGQVREYLAVQEEKLKNLATNPDLIWFPSDFVRKHKKGESQTLSHGDKAYYVKDGKAFAYDVPSYKSEHKSRVSDTERNIKGAKYDIKVYEDAIKTWKPQDPTPVKVTGATVHKAALWKGKGPSAPKCKQWGLHRPSGAPNLTEDDEKVTCKGCLRVAATEAKEKAEREAKKTYLVCLPDGSIKESDKSKRPLTHVFVETDVYNGKVSYWAEFTTSEKSAQRKLREAKKHAKARGEVHDERYQVLETTVRDF